MEHQHFRKLGGYFPPKFLILWQMNQRSFLKLLARGMAILCIILILIMMVLMPSCASSVKITTTKTVEYQSKKLKTN